MTHYSSKFKVQSSRLGPHAEAGVAQLFQAAGSRRFPAPGAGLESPANPQAGKPALQPAEFGFKVFAFLLLLLLLAASGPSFAQNLDEARAFESGVRAFRDGLYERAERGFAEFARRYPQSLRLSEAILLEARAALEQKRLLVAVDLLTTNIARAGLFADEYRYWLAETHMSSGNYQAAADSYGLLIREFANSVRLLEASYGEALARFKLKDWGRVAALLQRPDGTFQQAARLRARDDLVVRGALLLGEALLEQGQYPQAEEAVGRLAEPDLIPEYKWRRQYLLCRIQRAAQHLPAALACSTNLLTLAGTTGQPDLQAESVAWQAGLFEQLGDAEAAAQVYEKNLFEGMPPERRRHARLKIIELTLAQDKLAEATQKLGIFFTQNPADKASDLALLTLGELHLRQHLALADPKTSRTNVVDATAPAVTNHLDLALAELDKLITNSLPSPLLGKAQLVRGWCLWAADKVPESLGAYKRAADQLPYSVDQGVARFKLADAQFVVRDLTNALQNYRRVVQDYADLPPVQEGLLAHAWFQMLRIGLDLNDLAVATEALENILKEFPESGFADRGVLLTGQGLSAVGQPAAARRLFGDFLKRFGARSPLVPEVELALARSYSADRNWPAALDRLENWLDRFDTSALRPRAEFTYGWVNYQAGRETNTFGVFTNLVAQFPTNALAPVAQFWVADYFYRQGQFRDAERNYQLLFQNANWATNPLAYQARMMAGRAAFARQDYSQAEDYFTNLLRDVNCPTGLVAEAFFALGDTFTQQDLEPNKPLKKFTEAIQAFKKIPQLYAAGPLVPAAWGRIGDCYLQLAAQAQDATLYINASNAYQTVLALPDAGVAARSQAEVGLALVLQAQAKLAPDNPGLLKPAREHYLNVFYGDNLREGEKPAPYWVREAGLAAARLSEELKEWEVAVNLYKELAGLLPVLRPTLDKKIEKAQAQLRLEKE